MINGGGDPGPGATTGPPVGFVGANAAVFALDCWIVVGLIVVIVAANVRLHKQQHRTQQAVKHQLNTIRNQQHNTIRNQQQLTTQQQT